MTELPQCRWRGVEGPANHYPCASKKLVVPTGLVTGEICAQCPYVDHAPPPDRGLGDTVARVLRRVGVPPCGGCKERQEFLNKVIPYQ